jgi:Sec-independent protein translocase protein TatA
MPFGVSATTLSVLALGALALGPKDVPLVARALGRVTGRAVAHIKETARAVDRATRDGELRGMRDEVRASVRDLRGVAREIERELVADLGATRLDADADADARASERANGSGTVGKGGESVRHDRVIPVSAREVGSARAREGGRTTGSDVLAAMHEERDVAFRAARFMESGAIDAYLEKREREDG